MPTKKGHAESTKGGDSTEAGAVSESTQGGVSTEAGAVSVSNRHENDRDEASHHDGVLGIDRFEAALSKKLRGEDDDEGARQPSFFSKNERKNFKASEGAPDAATSRPGPSNSPSAASSFETGLQAAAPDAENATLSAVAHFEDRLSAKLGGQVSSGSRSPFQDQKDTAATWRPAAYKARSPQWSESTSLFEDRLDAKLNLPPSGSPTGPTGGASSSPNFKSFVAKGSSNTQQTSKLDGEAKTETRQRTPSCGTARPGAFSVTPSAASAAAVASDPKGRDIADKCPPCSPHRRWTGGVVVAGGGPVTPKRSHKSEGAATITDCQTPPRPFDAITDKCRAMSPQRRIRVMAQMSVTTDQKWWSDSANGLDQLEEAIDAKLASDANCDGEGDSLENALHGRNTASDQEMVTSDRRAEYLNGLSDALSSKLSDDDAANQPCSNASSFRTATHSSKGLVVAVAVNEDEERHAVLPEAVAYDPDTAKSPFYRDSRFCAKAVGAFLVLLTIAIGCGVAIANGQQARINSSAADPEPLFPLPTLSPTSHREGLGIRSKIEGAVGTEALADTDSVYSRALDWITFDDPMQLLPEASNFVQRFLCASIYFSVGGPSWFWCKEDSSRTGCSYEKWISFEHGQKLPLVASRWLGNSSECKWAGNKCTSGGEIKEMQLRRFNLSGAFPDAILKLSSLEKVDFAENNLDGTLPHLLGELRNLTWIGLRGNHFIGPIPESWWGLKNLEFFDIRGNVGINGSLSTEIGKLKRIKELWINDNSIGGTIPTEIGEMTGVKRLHLEQNLFEGTLPKTLGYLSNARELFVNNNKVSGSLPDEIGQMTSLVTMHASDNMLSGQIPESLWNNTNLSRLYLSTNSFSGTISSSIQKLSRSLRELRIRDNQMTGRIPPEIGSLFLLSELSLQLNLLTGEVPKSLCFRNNSQAVLKALEVDCAKSRLSDLTEVECSQGCCTWCCDSDGDCCDAGEDYCE